MPHFNTTILLNSHEIHMYVCMYKYTHTHIDIHIYVNPMDGRRSLVVYSPWSRKKSDTTNQLNILYYIYISISISQYEHLVP